FRRALEINPRFARARISLYRTLVSLNMHDEAIKEIDVLIEEGLRFPDLYLDRGRIFLKLGPETIAIEALRKALELNPKMKEAYWLLSGIKENMNRRGEAVQILEDYLAQVPDDPEASTLLHRIQSIKSHS
ncbi:MAG: tetratricopeptide repeat protein, partial [Deltaproteobacteria bacterium]|nr:tetratricopeptide repeat protein [Deltaproteobacteria bacterium]